MEEQWIKDLKEFVCEPPDLSELWASVPSPYAGYKWDEERHKYQKEKQAYFFTKENQSKAGKIGGNTTKSNKLGIFADNYDRTPNAKKAGKLSTGGIVSRNNKKGFHSLPVEIVNEFRKKGREQKYKCLVTGYISNAAGLSNYQKGKGINYKDKSLREKIM